MHDYFSIGLSKKAEAQNANLNLPRERATGNL